MLHEHAELGHVPRSPGDIGDPGLPMTGLLVGCGLGLFPAACAFLLAARRRNQRDHAEVVRSAITSMSDALEVDVPQHGLLGGIAQILASQDHATLDLQRQIWGLLPESVPAAGDVCPQQRLDRLTALVTGLWRHEQALAGIHAGLTGALAQAEPHDLVSVFVAGQFGGALGPVSRAQFVLAHDGAGQVGDPLVVSEALRGYRADMMADAVSTFLADAPEHSAQRAELVAGDLIRPAAAAIFAAGVRDLPSFADAPREPDQSAQLGASRPDGSPEDSQPDAEPGLQLPDVFEVSPASGWLADARAYFPFFTFVVSDLVEFRRLGDAHTKLDSAQAHFRQDAAGWDGNGNGTPPGPVLPLWAADPARVLIRTLIGPRITDRVLARRVTWRMSETNAALMRLLHEADIAIRRLADGIYAILAAERAGYLAEIGPVPRLDTIDQQAIKLVAVDLHNIGQLHVRLARLLLAQSGGLPRHDGGPGADAETSQLWNAVAAAETGVTASRNALSAGAYLRAVCELLRIRLPLAKAGFPGLTFHQALLSQARPLVVLAMAHRLALARWTAVALTAYFRRRPSLARAISAEVDKYRRAHDEIVLGVNHAVNITGNGGV